MEKKPCQPGCNWIVVLLVFVAMLVILHGRKNLLVNQPPVFQGGLNVWLHDKDVAVRVTGFDVDSHGPDGVELGMAYQIANLRQDPLEFDQIRIQWQKAVDTTGEFSIGSNSVIVLEKNGKTTNYNELLPPEVDQADYNPFIIRSGRHFRSLANSGLLGMRSSNYRVVIELVSGDKVIHGPFTVDIS